MLIKHFYTNLLDISIRHEYCRLVYFKFDINISISFKISTKFIKFNLPTLFVYIDHKCYIYINHKT